MEKFPDHIYYDISIHNSSSVFKQAEFKETRQRPILNKKVEYYMTITSAYIPTHNMPIFVAEPLNVLDVDDLAYSVTFVNGLNKVAVNLKMLPFYDITSIPVPTVVDAKNRVLFYQYYSVLSYSKFLRMLNVALQSAFDLIKGNLPVDQTATPYVVLDPSTQLLSIIVQSSYTQGIGPQTQIFFDSKLFEKIRLQVNYLNLNNLQQYALLFLGINNTPTNVTGSYLISPPQSSSTITIPVGKPGAGTQGYLITQDFSSLWSWNDFLSIVVESYISVNASILSGPINGLGQDSRRKTILSFTPEVKDGTEIRNAILYKPQIHRLVDVDEGSDLREFDVKIYWQDNLQNLFPIVLDAYDSCLVEFMFRIKKLGI